MTVTLRDHLYTESGLPDVLLDGVEFRSCPQCDEEEMVIPRIARLHRLIAERVAEKESRLTVAERLIRLMSLRARPVEAYPNERLADVAKGEPSPLKLNLETHRTGWKDVKSAA